MSDTQGEVAAKVSDSIHAHWDVLMGVDHEHGASYEIINLVLPLEEFERVAKYGTIGEYGFAAAYAGLGVAQVGAELYGASLWYGKSLRRVFIRCVADDVKDVSITRVFGAAGKFGTTEYSTVPLQRAAKGGFFRQGAGSADSLAPADADRMLGIARRVAGRMNIDAEEIYGIRQLGPTATGRTAAGRHILLDPKAFQRVYDHRLGRYVSPMENLKRTIIHEHGHVMQAAKHPELYWEATSDPTTLNLIERGAYRFEDFWYGTWQRRIEVP